ncbi:MAG: tetratricopeptide repeat protein [bacterium]|nr:tetratricopeptide repeat protein [bacterium]
MRFGSIRLRGLLLITGTLGIIWYISGCGGGGGLSDGGMGSLAQNLAQGWALMESGSYSDSITKFNNVLSGSPTAIMEADARTGLGWAYAKQGSISTAISHFERASNVNNDANVGLAGCYLARGNATDYSQAIALLNFIDQNGGGISLYSSPHTGVAPAELYAVLGYCHFLDGDEDKAKQYVEEAKKLDAYNESVLDIEDALKALGLSFD